MHDTHDTSLKILCKVYKISWSDMKKYKNSKQCTKFTKMYTYYKKKLKITQKFTTVCFGTRKLVEKTVFNGCFVGVMLSNDLL
jgi:hypothetical protein